MQFRKLPIIAGLLFILLLPGCELVASIFAAGVIVGIIVLVIIIALIIWAISALID